MPVKIIEGEEVPVVQTAEVISDEDGNVVIIARTRLVQNLIEGHSDHYVTEAPTPRFGSCGHVGFRKLAHVTIPGSCNLEIRDLRTKPNAKNSARKRFRSKHWRRFDGATPQYHDDVTSSILDAFASFSRMDEEGVLMFLGFGRRSAPTTV